MEEITSSSQDILARPQLAADRKHVGQARLETPQAGRATIKVCLHSKCCQRGAEDIYKNLKDGLTKEEAIVLSVYACFGFCKEGPNIAINDNIVKGVRPFLAIEVVRAELDNPSCKADGLGSKSIDALDDVLDEITTL